MGMNGEISNTQYRAREGKGPDDCDEIIYSAHGNKKNSNDQTLACLKYRRWTREQIRGIRISR